jgi:hypothetical protein
MLRSRIAILFVYGALALVLAGCGGNGAAPELGATNQTAQAVAPQAGGGMRLAGPGVEAVPATWFDQGRHDDLTRLRPVDTSGSPAGGYHAVVAPPDLSILGELPPYQAESNSQPRAASEVRQIDVSSPVVATANVVAAPGSLDIPSAVGTTEWAQFTAPLNPGEDLVAFSATGTLVNGAHGTDSGLWIALSNYSLDQWQIFGPYSLSTQVIVNLDPGNYMDTSDTAHLVLGPAKSYPPSFTPRPPMRA